MITITYKASTVLQRSWHVYVDNRKVGNIVRRKEGFVYRTKGGHTGDFFPTFNECLNSLRGVQS